MQRPLARTLVVSLLLSLFAIVGAQGRFGQISGVVTDASGAVLPGVTVEVFRASTSVRVMITDGHGEFSISNLEPGPYIVQASLTGFATTGASVDVAASQVHKLSLIMKVGTLEESVTVSGASPQSRMRDSGFNTEAYDKIDDNQWNEVRRKPLSTFSIDVDTASYSNVRRFLNQGQMPPKDAVRIEELINYFSYDYPAPAGERPFSITTAVDICPWNDHHRLALIGLQAKRIDSADMPPRNLVFLIDVSGSMLEPRKLPLVKASLAMLAPNLTEKDRVSIVVYAGRTGLVLPPTSGADTPTILDALTRLEAGGSTNGGAGLTLAYKTAEDNFIKGGVNRVILATDGDFNVGVTNQGDLIRLIEEKRDSGVTLSVLGFGMGNLKDSTMEKLADKGNGNYFYIDSLAEAQKVLVQEAGGTLVMVAKDVKLQVEFNPRSVAAYRLIGYEKRLLQDQDFNNDRKDAGDMGAGHSVTALYEIVPAGGAIALPGIDPLKYQRPAAPSAAAGKNEVMTVKLRYKQPEDDVSALFSSVVMNRMEETPELGFASAVAEYGMLLRGSEFKGAASFADVRSRATKFKGDDPHGHRAEFISLVDAAESVNRLEPHTR